MARIRSVKPQLRTSLTVAEWPREVRYFWVLLWGYLDDEGRGVDDVRLIKADCFPLDDDVTRATVDEWLTLMMKPTDSAELTGPVCRYPSAGRRYLHAPDWKDHQKPQHPRPSDLPPCPWHDLGEPYGPIHEDAPVIGGKLHEPLMNDSRGAHEATTDTASTMRDAVPVEGASSQATAIHERLMSDSGAAHEPLTPEGEGSRRGVGVGEAPAENPRASPPKSETLNQRGNRLARIYTDRVKLSNFAAVAGIVKKAIQADFTDEQITAGLNRLADDGRACTADGLRYAINGPPPSQFASTGTRGRTVSSAQKLAGWESG